MLSLNTIVKASVDAFDSYPVGTIMKSVRTPAANWLRMDNSEYLQSAYPALFALMGVGPPLRYAKYVSSILAVTTGTLLGMAWSPSGRYLAVTTSLTPFLTVYDFNTGSPVKLADPATLPLVGTSTPPMWSPNSRYVQVVMSASPLMRMYDLNTGSLVVVSAAATQPGNTPNTQVWSPNGAYFATGHAGTPFISVYAMGTGTPVKLANPSVLPLTSVTSIVWSPDSRYFSGTTSNNVVTYDTNGAALVQSDTEAMQPIPPPLKLWSPDGTDYYYQTSAAPFLGKMTRSAGVLTSVFVDNYSQKLEHSSAGSWPQVIDSGKYMMLGVGSSLNQLSMLEGYDLSSGQRRLWKELDRISTAGGLPPATPVAHYSDVGQRLAVADANKNIALYAGYDYDTTTKFKLQDRSSEHLWMKAA